MLRSLACQDLLAHNTPIIDVRSPLEFEHAHIPGAHSLPLFTDEERAVVGTLYKHEGRDVALLEGLRIAGPKLADIVERARGIAPEQRIRIHCWRGGERSASVAWLLEKAGFAEVLTLRGGYKAFRRHVLESFQAPMHLCILGGYTGTGKTAVLEHLGALKEQVIDLEAIAHHKGSSFGGIGEDPQPSTEQFENELWAALQRIDPQRPCWVEDESATIGRVKIPDPFYARMRASQLYFAEMPVNERTARLVEDYGHYHTELLAEAITRIRKRIGPQHCTAALEALANGDLHTVALISLRYYDKTYAHGASQRDPQRVTRLPASRADLRGLAKRLKDHAASTAARH